MVNACTSIRATADVDVITEITTLAEYYGLQVLYERKDFKKIVAEMRRFVAGRYDTLFWM